MLNFIIFSAQFKFINKWKWENVAKEVSIHKWHSKDEQLITSDNKLLIFLDPDFPFYAFKHSILGSISLLHLLKYAWG